MRAELEARQAEAKLTPEERTERRLRGARRPVTEQLSAPPARPRGWALAREAVAAKWRREDEEERVERERKDGTLARRERYDQAVQAIAEKRDADLQAERERHDANN